MSLAGERAGLGHNPDQRLHPVTLEAGARHMSHVGQDGSVSLLTRLHDLPSTRRMLGVDLDSSRRI
jgi:hypothetical protein